MSEAMHNEALRKSRMIERKTNALRNMKNQCEPETVSGPMPGYVNHDAYQTHYQEEFYAKQRASRQDPVPEYTWEQVERHLRREAKVLRNNNLYMGHIDCFKDLQNRGLLNIKKQ